MIKWSNARCITRLIAVYLSTYLLIGCASTDNKLDDGIDIAITKRFGNGFPVLLENEHVSVWAFRTAENARRIPEPVLLGEIPPQYEMIAILGVAASRHVPIESIVKKTRIQARLLNANGLMLVGKGLTTDTRYPQFNTGAFKAIRIIGDRPNGAVSAVSSDRWKHFLEPVVNKLKQDELSDSTEWHRQLLRISLSSRKVINEADPSNVEASEFDIVSILTFEFANRLEGRTAKRIGQLMEETAYLVTYEVLESSWENLESQMGEYGVSIQ